MAAAPSRPSNPSDPSPAQASYRFFGVTTPLSPCSSHPLPLWPGATLVRRHLYVAVRTVGRDEHGEAVDGVETSSDCQEVPEVAVFAVLAAEYVLDGPAGTQLANGTWRAGDVLVHVDRADSTGFPSPPAAGTLSPSRAVMLRLFSRILSSKPPGSRVRFALAARPAPHYIFPSSPPPPTKRVLSHTNLAKWWASSLNLLSTAAAALGLPGNDVKKCWTCPGTDGPTDPSVRSLSRVATAADGWTYGSPYPPSSLASECIPRFEDDPKGKIAGEAEVGETVDEFWQKSGVTADCGVGGGVVNCVFGVEVDLSRGRAEGGNKTEDAGPHKPIADSEEVSDFVFDATMSRLSSSDFSTLPSSVHATRTLLAILHDAGITGVEMDIPVAAVKDPTGADAVNTGTALERAPCATAAEGLSDAPAHARRRGASPGTGQRDAPKAVVMSVRKKRKVQE